MSKDLPSRNFSVVVKMPVAVKKPSEVQFLEDRMRFGRLTWRGETEWEYEVPYSEIIDFDWSREVRGIVKGRLRDGRALEFRLKAGGPRREILKNRTLAAVAAELRMSGSIKKAGAASATKDDEAESTGQAVGEMAAMAADEEDLPEDTAPGNDPEEPAKNTRTCLGCLGVIVVAVLLVVGVSALVGWVRGDNDPNREGSPAWCRSNGLSDEGCSDLNSVADLLDQTPSEVLESISGAADAELSCARSGNRMNVDADCFGDDWPLTVQSGTLACADSAVTFTTNGVLYAVNGMATSFGRGVDIEPIWADDPGTGFKVNIGRLIDQGLDLC